jgi:DNA-binding transcriptional LysR family regulator
MELRHLRSFVAVAEELHFRRAAERLHVAQPAVSEQIRKLEAELGVQLLDRSRRTVSLTDAGSVLLEEARRVLTQAESARNAVLRARDERTTRLRIGYLADTMPAALPRTVRHLATAAPRIEVRMSTASTDALLEDVRGGRLDAAVVDLPAATAGLRVTPLGPQRLVAVLPAESPLARQPRVSVAQVLAHRLVGLPREANPALHNTILALGHRAGLTTTLVEVDEPKAEIVLLAVAAGEGVALLPAAVAQRLDMPGVRILDCDAIDPAFRSAVVTRAHADDLPTAAFLRSLGAVVAREAAAAPATPALAAA